MRRWLLGILAAAVLMAPVPGEAQFTFGPIATYHADFDFGVGGMVGTSLTAFGVSESVALFVDFVYYFPDQAGIDTFFEVDANFTYDLPLGSSAADPFVFAGFNLGHWTLVNVGGVSFDDDELGINLGAGIELDVGPLRPTLGAKIELNGADGFVIFAMLPLALGS